MKVRKAFQSSENKDVVRRKWDLLLISEWREIKAQNLTYLGLPGPELRDLIDWQDYLARERTAVEGYYAAGKSNIDPDIQQRILTNAMALGGNFSSGFQLLRGDVESLILTGHDMNGAFPQCSKSRGEYWFYDLINLDFCGGVGYESKRGISRRISALKKIFERQCGHDFLLLLTFNVRSTVGKQIEEYLDDAQARFGCGNPRFAQLLNAHRAQRGNKMSLVLKAAIPCIIQQFSEPHGFAVRCYPPVEYTGTGRAVLVHFAFQCMHINRSGFPVHSDRFTFQSLQEILELPLMGIRDGEIIALEEFK